MVEERIAEPICPVCAACIKNTAKPAEATKARYGCREGARAPFCPITKLTEAVKCPLGGRANCPFDGCTVKELQ